MKFKKDKNIIPDYKVLMPMKVSEKDKIVQKECDKIREDIMFYTCGVVPEFKFEWIKMMVKNK